MSRNGLIRSILTATLAITVPAAAAAQDGSAGLEGTDWHLTAYSSEGEMTAVPWMLDAFLLLEDGTASGSDGCNTFDGEYTTADASLTFGEASAQTLRACTADAAIVEQGYMSQLPETATWAIDDGVLRFSNAEAAVVLEFETGLVGLTASDVVALVSLLESQQAEIDKLGKRVDNVNITTLRGRIKQLESQVETLRGQVETLRSSNASSGSSGVSFSATEKILLEGVPKPIKTSCRPRRSDLPAGTLAALQCPPNASAVRDLAYYLMSGNAATNVFKQRMSDNGVKGGSGQCRNGRAAISEDVPGPGALGCYLNTDGRANLRIVEPASGCDQLKVGARTLKIPAIYVAVLGNDGDIRKLARWAESPLGQDGLVTSITRPNMPLSPRCPS